MLGLQMRQTRTELTCLACRWNMMNMTYNGCVPAPQMVQISADGAKIVCHTRGLENICILLYIYIYIHIYIYLRTCFPDPSTQFGQYMATFARAQDERGPRAKQNPVTQKLITRHSREQGAPGNLDAPKKKAPKMVSKTPKVLCSLVASTHENY